MLAYVFPGQGSQFIGMGKTLFAQFPELVVQANEILGYSIADLCLMDPMRQLHLTQFTQPAIYVVSALSYLAKLSDSPNLPDYVAGHSLGEYNALFAAEVFDFAQGLRIVKKRAELMSEAPTGGMAAVIGIPRESLITFLQKHHYQDIVIANHNAPEQLVIAGTRVRLQAALALIHSVARVVPLNVSGAFHSPLMKPIQNAFANFLAHEKFNTPSLPVLANVNTEPYHPAVIKSFLTEQLTQPVAWVGIVRRLLKNKVSCEEIGPGRVLTDLLAKFVDSNNMPKNNVLV